MATLNTQFGVPIGTIGPDMADHLISAVRNHRMHEYLFANRDAMEAFLARLSITGVTWRDLSDAISDRRRNLSVGRGDQTLDRLLSGLQEAIRLHPLSNCGNPAP